MRILVTSLAFISATIFPQCFVRLANAVDVGQEGPSFTVKSVDGAPLQLNDYSGKVIYLDIWASWCSACRQSLPWMEELQSKYGDKGFQVIAVNVDEEREAADNLLREKVKNLLVGFDPDGIVPQLYKASSMPSSYLIDRSGAIVSIHDRINQSEMRRIEEEISKHLSKEPI
ncbi:MAG: redoxin domain-containing protein [Bdellovibrionales bacterium]|nr:redoxin domain-containing protein [Bdellovibrionales bacterium]